MNKIYHLGTCSTCQAIIKTLDLQARGFEFQDIKKEAITEAQLDEMAQATGGSYEALFSRRAMKFRSMGLNNETLDENDYRRLILSEYTFLKRPVICVNGEWFVGNSKKTVAAAQLALG